MARISPSRSSFGWTTVSTAMLSAAAEYTSMSAPYSSRFLATKAARSDSGSSAIWLKYMALTAASGPTSAGIAVGSASIASGCVGAPDIAR